jgi:hypothetical protein
MKESVISPFGSDGNLKHFLGFRDSGTRSGVRKASLLVGIAKYDLRYKPDKSTNYSVL